MSFVFLFIPINQKTNNNVNETIEFSSVLLPFFNFLLKIFFSMCCFSKILFEYKIVWYVPYTLYISCANKHHSSTGVYFHFHFHFHRLWHVNSITLICSNISILQCYVNKYVEFLRHYFLLYIDTIVPPFYKAIPSALRVWPCKIWWDKRLLIWV